MAKASHSKVWRPNTLEGVELLRAQHLNHAFPRHTHDGYAVGVIEQGALGYFYRGENVVAASGDINLCVPDEAHTGQAVDGAGWTYRMFYLDVSYMQRVASELAGKPQALPFFQWGALSDDALAKQFRRVHQQLEQLEAEALEHESLLLHVLAIFIYRYADDAPTPQPAGKEPLAVRQVKDYLESYYASNITLNDLAQLTQLSRYHLLRVFRDAVAVPPHAYLRQVRVRRAKTLLRSGTSIANAALATGFSDQSHLSRWFKRLWGVTPNVYRNSVQDS